MNKIYSLVLCACALFCLASPGAVAATAINLIANPSLEIAAGTLPQGWSQAKTGTNTASFTYPSTGAQNGTRSVKIAITKWTSGDAKWFFNPVPVNGGKQYYFRNYYKASVAVNTYAEYTNAIGQKTVAVLGQNPAKTAWTLSEYAITVPTDAVSMTVYQTLARIGTLQTDNYQLSEVPAVIITDNVPNASLEQEDAKGNPLAWSTEKSGTNTAAFAYAATGHTGSRSVTATISRFTSGSAAWLYEAQPIEAGKYYEFSDYYKSNIISTVSARVKTASGLDATIRLKDAPASVAWTRYADRFQAPANASTVTIIHAAAKKGFVTTDDYSLVEIPSTGILTVRKVVANTAGGVKTPADFSFSVNGAPAVAFEADGQNDLTQNPGTYTIVETPVADYAVSYDNCSNITLTAGSAAVCTITNTYIDPAVVELIPNPSMETPAGDTLPLNWSTDSWGTGVSAAFTYETTGHTGNRSITAALNACATGSWCEARWYFDRVPTKAGQTYTFSEYYKSNVPAQVYVQFITTTGILDKTNIQLTSWDNPLPAALDWTLYTATFTAPANAIQFTILNTLDSQNGIGGWLTIDDLSIMGSRDPGLNRGIVSLNFDDGFSSVYANAFPVMSAKNFKSTQFIISDCVTAAGGTCTTLDGDSDLPIMTRAQMLEMYNAGHEIASHTKTHRRLSLISGADQITELSESKAALNALFSPVTNMATPYGDFNAEALASIKLNYRSHRTTAIGYNTHDYADPYYLQVQYVMPTTTLAEFQGWLDKANIDRSWLILLYHSVGDDNESTEYDYNLTTSAFAAQMDAIQSSGLAVLTNEQALNEVEPQLAD
jgi:peptidoglycan/xylan/chitin deacetylase (PgdA/CDA1 family)